MYPLVSVVVPTYNRSKLLVRTIDSILNQTYENIELIVVSDGSTDNTKETVTSIGDKRILFTEQANSGGCASPRNHGIRLSKGDYIAFCDDDDIWLSTKLEKQMSELENHPNSPLCYTNMSRFDETTEWINSIEGGYADFKTLLNFNNIAISSVVVRRNILNEIGCFNEDRRVGSAEDYEFLLRVSWKNKLCYVDEPLVRYCSESNRMTKKDEEISVSDLIEYYKFVFFSFMCVKKQHQIRPDIFIVPILKQVYNFHKRVYVYFRNKVLERV